MRIKGIIDCSTPLHSALVTWPGDTVPQRVLTETLQKDGAEVSRWTFSAHSGTHVDAPRHFTSIPTGADELSLDALMGSALVLDLTAIEGTSIEPQHIPEKAFQYKRLLFKTSNSTRRLLDQPTFVTDYVSLSAATAQLLVDRGVRVIGVDFLSVEKKGNPGHPVHVTLLTAGIINIEGVRLIDVDPGAYTLIALPIKLKGSDGAPCRVVLLEEEE